MKRFYIFIGIVLLISLSFASYRYSLVGKTCLTGGCYGPMRLVLQTTTGEHVEDVVIEVSYSGPGGLFCLHGTCYVDIYREILVANTDEEVILPRGFFVRRSPNQPEDSTAFSISSTVYHPDYENVVHHIDVPNMTEGIVDLGVTKIISKQETIDQWNMNVLRRKGLSKEEINKRLEENSVRLPGVYPSYFARLLALERDDLVDKYLPERLRKLAEYRSYNESQATALGVRVRQDIKEKADRL